MNQPHLLDKLPTPVRIFLRPMLLISLGLHGVVLMLPTSFNWEKTQPSKKEETVKITKLPSAVKASPEASPQSLLIPNRETTPQVRQPTYSQPWETTPQVRQPIYSQPWENSPVQQPGSPQPRQQSTTSPVIEQQSTPTTAPKKSQSNPDLPESTNTTPENSNVKDPLEDFLNNFPFPKNSQRGSLYLLSGDADESALNVDQTIEQVVSYYQKELKDREYQQEIISQKENNLKIIKVSKKTISQYLHLIDQDSKTIILLSEKPLDNLSELAKMALESLEERELKAIIKQSIKNDSVAKITSDIEKKLQGGKYNSLGMVAGKTPEQLGSEFMKDLNNPDKQFQISLFADLQKDGQIYQVSKNDFKGFIQLIPTEDGQKTAIISLDDLNL